MATKPAWAYDYEARSGKLVEQDVQEAWTDEARAAAAEARRHDTNLGAAKVANNGAGMGEALKGIHANSPKVIGFNDRGDRQTKKAIGAEDIKASRNAAHKALTEAGYKVSNKAKMMGGSETIVSYRHPEMPNHRYTIHENPHTRGGQRENTITVQPQQ